ncbi:MAG: hypothetical protein V4539_11625 [Bacteroidota bacterium]
MGARWTPLKWFIAVGIINEFISQFWIQSHHSNYTNSNIYVGIEFALILWQFYAWTDGSRVTKTRLLFFRMAALIGFFAWIGDNLLLHRIDDNNSLFRIIYSAIIVLFSIDRLNCEAVYEKRRLLHNAIFLVCMTFMVYYANKAFVESFNLYHFNIRREFYVLLWVIMNIINIAASILYSIAVLCIRPKTILQLPY